MADKLSPSPRDASIVERFIDLGAGLFMRANAITTTAAGVGTLGRRVISAANTNETAVKAAPGQVYGIEMANNAAYAVFLKLYNKATAPNLAVDIPVRTIQIPPGGRCEINRPNGMVFSTGIAYAITKLVADNDTTALAAADVVGSIDYV